MTMIMTMVRVISSATRVLIVGACDDIAGVNKFLKIVLVAIMMTMMMVVVVMKMIMIEKIVVALR